jgi:hypothetical protein
MSSKLASKAKLSRKNRYGKCDWQVELEVHEGRAVYNETQIFLKRTWDEVKDLLRRTCNCTIPKELA